MGRVRARLSAILFGLVIALGGSAALSARTLQPSGDCARPGFAASFDRRFTTCEEMTRIPIYWGGGRTTDIVVLRTEGLAMDSHSNAAVAHLREVASRMGAALDQMGGDFEVHPIFVMLTDRRSAMNGAEAYAYEPGGAFPDECHAAVFAGASDAEPGYLQFVIAHELFHCVQYATWEDGLLMGDNEWWVEGSAEYFANLVFPGTRHSAGMVVGFHADSPDTSLLDLAYENVVLYSWIDQRFGGPRVRAFLAAVADAAAGEEARAAAESALTPEQWLEFAKDYVAGDIALPGGVGVGPPTDMPTQGPDRPLELVGAPLVLVRATLTYEPGRYDNLIDRRAGPHAARNNGSWGELPEELDLDCEEDATYVFAAISAGTQGIETVITPAQTEERGCSSCDALERPARSCLIGTWHFAGHQNFCSTFAANLAAGGAQLLQCDEGEGQVTFSADGAMTGDTGGQHILVRMNEDMTMDIVQELSSTARWGARDGRLQICQATSLLTGSQTISAAGMSQVVPVNQSGPPEDGEVSFTCTATTLTITSDTAPGAFLGIGPVQVLERVH